MEEKTHYLAATTEWGREGLQIIKMMQFVAVTLHLVLHKYMMCDFPQAVTEKIQICALENQIYAKNVQIFSWMVCNSRVMKNIPSTSKL